MQGPTQQELHLQVQARLIEELSEKQHAFQTHLDLLEEIVFRCDLKGCLTLLNEAWTRTLGFPIAESIGTSLSKFFAESLEWDALKQALRGSDQVNAEVGLVSSDGDIRTFTLGVRRRGDEWYGSLHDVSELRLTVDALKLSEEKTRKLSLVASRTDNLVIITDAQGRIDWVNSAFEKSSGFTLAEVRGQKPGQMLQGPLTDQLVVASISRKLTAGEGFESELINYNRAGVPYWVAIYCTPVFDEAGKIIQFIAIERDISERKRTEAALKESERRFRQILDSVSEAIFLCTDQLELKFVNPAWCQLTGSDQASSLERSLWDFVNPEDQTKVVEAQRRIEAAETEIVRVEVRVLGKHAEWRRSELVLSKSNGLQDSNAGYTGALIDIDERWQVTQATVEAKQRAEDLSHARTRFVANMSHEIRTPLNAIIGMTSVLEATELNANQHLCVDTILSGSRALLSLVNDILDVAKIDSGAIELEQQVFSLAAVCDEAVDLVAASVQEKGLLLTHYMAPDVPAFFVGDAHRLRQVLINLLSNAFKFTSDGGVEIHVEWQAVQQNDGVLGIEVRDTGVGIPPDRLGSLFDAFTQADSSITRKFGGTGLGLTICKQICELMHGEISATSKLGCGSIFRFEVRLPTHQKRAKQRLGGVISSANLDQRWRRVVECMAAIHDIEVQSCEQSDAAPSLTWSDGSGFEANCPVELATPVLTPGRLEKTLLRGRSTHTEKDFAKQPSTVNASLRILIAEDVKANQIVIQSMLQQLGYCEITVVDDGQQAVDRAKSKAFDLIILDVHMPVLDGINAAHRIKETLNSSCPRMVVASADVTVELRDAARAVGIEGWLSKPFVREQLAQVLRGDKVTSEAWL